MKEATFINWVTVKRCLLASLLILGLAPFAYAQAKEIKSTLIIGGSPVEGVGSFDKLVQRLSASLANRRWNVTALSGPGVTEEKVEQALAALANQNGGSALIWIMGPGTEPANDSFHSVQVGAGWLLNLKRIRSAADALARKASAAKVAVVDYSCFSGSTQKISQDNPDICTVTASASHYISTGDFNVTGIDFWAAFADIPASGEIDIESHFRKSRLIDNSTISKELTYRPGKFEVANATVNIPSISSLSSPFDGGDVTFFEYFFSNFDPWSYYRDHRVEQRQACLGCAANSSSNLKTTINAIDDTVRALGHFVDSEFLRLAGEMKKAASEYFDAYADIENLVTSISNTAARGNVDVQLPDYRKEVQRLRAITKTFLWNERLFYERYQLVAPKRNSSCRKFEL